MARLFKREGQANDARVEKCVWASPPGFDISLPLDEVVSFDHVLDVRAFRSVEDEERDHPPVSDCDRRYSCVSDDGDGFSLGRVANGDSLPMPFVFGHRDAP